MRACRYVCLYVMYVCMYVCISACTSAAVCQHIHSLYLYIYNIYMYREANIYMLHVVCLCCNLMCTYVCMYVCILYIYTYCIVFCRYLYTVKRIMHMTVHVRTREHIHMCMLTAVLVHAFSHLFVSPCRCSYIHTYINTYIRMYKLYIHAYLHMCTCTDLHAYLHSRT